MSPRFTFFAGKGGVGKTTLASAAAVRLAERGSRTLLVTTDPASNLVDVFEQPIGHRIAPVFAVPGLCAMEIDGDLATEEYRERSLAPLRAAFPPEMIRVMEEQMSGPCTSEVAAFDRFTDFLASDPDSDRRFDAVIFDTAPTGHTLRLLELPSEWSRVIASSSETGGQTCVGPAAAIVDSKRKYDAALAALRSPDRTRFVFVLQPEDTAIKETVRAIRELRQLGIEAFEIVVNGVIPAEEDRNPFFAAKRAVQQRLLDRIARELPLPARRVPLFDGEVRGVARLRSVGAALFGDPLPGGWPSISVSGRRRPASGAPITEEAVSRILPDGPSRTLFFAGKGGVGKTTASCMTAVWLARRGLKTLLVTTDPAAHIGDVLDAPVGAEAAPVPGLASLWAARIDARAAAAAYRARILEDARARGRSEASIRVMTEELDSPCTEEMAAFDQFVAFAADRRWQVIVFDTAPTGHTLRLLELPIDWSKQLDVKVYATVDGAAADDVAKRRFSGIIETMRDPSRCTFVYVMVPEFTPVAEAQRAARELETLGIRPGLVVVNQVLPEDVCATPFGSARRSMQEDHLAAIGRLFPVPLIRIPSVPGEIRGLAALVSLGNRVLGASFERGGDAVVALPAEGGDA